MNLEIHQSDRLEEMQAVQSIARTYLPEYQSSLSLFNKRLYAQDNNDKAKASTRLYFIEKVHQFVSQGPLLKTFHNETAMKIAIVGEFCITMMYLDNHLQDGKYGVKNEKSRRGNSIEREETRRAMNAYIEREFQGEFQEKIFFAVAKLFHYYHKGMELDKGALTFENYASDNAQNLHRVNEEIDAFVNVESLLKTFKENQKQKFYSLNKYYYLRLLFTRSFLINTVFFQIFAELMIDLYGDPRVSYANVVEYARLFGITQQLVNDNTDYLPVGYGFTTLCKWEEDTFCDMRRGLITLPIMVHLGKCKDQVDPMSIWYQYKETNHDLYSDTSQRELLRHMQECGSLNYAMGAVVSFAREARRLVNDSMWKENFSFCEANRYYKEFLRGAIKIQ